MKKNIQFLSQTEPQRQSLHILPRAGNGLMGGLCVEWAIILDGSCQGLQNGLPTRRRANQRTVNQMLVGVAERAHREPEAELI